MKIALTGGTGFIGMYILKQAVKQGHSLRCSYRSEKSIEPFNHFGNQVEWIPGNLDNHESMQDLVTGCDAVIHSALWKPGKKFQGEEGSLVRYGMINLVGTLALIEAAKANGVSKFIFLSSCAVHDRILEDRALDEKHPLWPKSHYGAYKAAIEKFVHSFGYGEGYEICALRPTAVYGVDQPVDHSKYYELIRKMLNGETVHVTKGSKEVHAADVAKASLLLLGSENIAGEAFNCYDQYISEYDVACLVQKLTGSQSEIVGSQKRPQHQIDTSKLEALGMKFGGDALLEQTIKQLIDSIQAS